MNIDWKNKPDWAIGYGYFGEGHYVWFSYNNYAPIKNPSVIYKYENEGRLYSEMQGKVFAPETKPEWNSKGIPPVGTVCELKPYWHKVLIVAHDVREEGTRIVYWDHHDSIYSYTYWHDLFRPIKSNKEKWIDQAIKIASRSASECDVTFSNAIYEALASGELPIPKGINNEPK